MTDRYAVHVYEPGCDPGGYEGEVIVTASDEADAHFRAVSKARECWPDAGMLTVWHMRHIGGGTDDGPV